MQPDGVIDNAGSQGYKAVVDMANRMKLISVFTAIMLVFTIIHGAMVLAHEVGETGYPNEFASSAADIAALPSSNHHDDNDRDFAWQDHGHDVLLHLQGILPNPDIHHPGRLGQTNEPMRPSLVTQAIWGRIDRPPRAV